MEAGSDNGNNRRSELAAVSGAMPYEPGAAPLRRPRQRRRRPAVRLPFPMVAAVGASSCDGVKRRRRPKRHETMREPMERRQGGGNDRRPELATVSGAMPNPPRLRRRALGGFCAGSGSGRPPRPPLSQALCSHGGSSRLRLPRRARPRPREQANTPPNSPRVRGAHRTPSFGPTRRLASITTREPGISGTPATARICARLTRAPPAIALRRTANVRPGLLLGKRASGLTVAAGSTEWRSFHTRLVSRVAAASFDQQSVITSAKPLAICSAVIAGDTV